MPGVTRYALLSLGTENLSTTDLLWLALRRYLFLKKKSSWIQLNFLSLITTHV